MDKYIGRLLDNRYEILEEIGSGGMAVVYKARCHRLNRLVAVKILKDDYLQDEEFKRRFHAESLAVAMLSHPNIVQVYDVFDSTEADYIVMELIDGISLKQYMEKKGVLNWKETLHFAIQIAKALEHAHSRGIVHRDIKPHNVMVLKNGSVKVTDFGIARMMSKGNTLTKEALGSVHYISPEQAKGGRVDNRSDIYSLGVVMYEMMTGKPPYDGESPVSVAIQHINGGAVMPSTLNPNIPGGLEQIIMKAMALDVSGRFRSAAELLADLDEFRKDPAILFDYNTPPLDDVLHIQRKPDVVDIRENGGSDTNQSASGLPPLSTLSTKKGTGNRMDMKEAGSKSGAVKSATAKPTGQSGQPRRRQPNQPRKSNRTTLFAIIGCSAAAVIALAILLCVLFLKSCGADVEEKLYKVPSFVGKTYAAGMTDPNFKIKRFPDEYHDTLPAGTIISQEPAAGEMKAEGTTIYLTVSKGKKEEVSGPKMPNVVRYTEASAKNTINSLGLNLGFNIKEEYHDSVRNGCVIRTEPEAGEELKRGTQVTLYISIGKDTSTIPMIPVEGLSQTEAVNRLNDQAWELQCQIVPEYVKTVKNGYVLRTDPKVDEPVRKGAVIKLYVAMGDSPVVPAGLAGKSAEEVQQIINKLFDGVLTEQLFIEYELVEEFHPTVEEGKVTHLSIEEGKPIATPHIPAKITLYISKGPLKYAMPEGIEVGDSYADVLKRLTDIGFTNVTWVAETGTKENAGKIAAVPAYEAGQMLLPETSLVFKVFVEEKTVTFTFAQPVTGTLKLTKNGEVFGTPEAVTDLVEHTISDKGFGSVTYKLYLDDGLEPIAEQTVVYGIG